MSRMGDLAIEKGEMITRAFPEKSWEESMEIVTGGLTGYRNCAFIDGSYNIDNSIYGSGGVIFDQNGEIAKFEQHGSNPSYVGQRNVAGEVEAARYCLFAAFNLLRMDEITIYHDYEGIQKWPDGERKANNNLSRTWRDEVAGYRYAGKRIQFKKVKAHSKNYWNDEADRLAKAACGNWRAI